MSFIDYLKINSSLTWRQLDVQNDVIILEDGKSLLSDRYIDGTGISEVNKGFFKASTVPSGEKIQFDYFNLTRSMFGVSTSTNFSGDSVKLLYIENLSTGAGKDLFVCGTGVGGFTNLLGYSYLGFIVKPSSYAIFYDLINGFPISTGERYLYLQDINGNSGGISYELATFGVSQN